MTSPDSRTTNLVQLALDMAEMFDRLFSHGANEVSAA